MNTWLHRLGSTRFALWGMGLLAVGAAFSYNNPAETSVWVLVVPLFILAVNLMLAIIINPAINRRRGLLLFHIGLLALVILVAVGRLTHMEAHIELVNGAAFDTEALFDVQKGPWHSDDLQHIQFIQQGFSVEFRPRMKRGLTHNQILVSDTNGQLVAQEIGDDRPLLMHGYRIYSTSNKGFAPRLTWVADNGAIEQGSIHMPSYPLLYFRQANEWTPPGGELIKFWLQLDTGLDKDNAWVLDPASATGVLVINASGQRNELSPGQSLSLPGGTLYFDELSSWMGFKVFYDPTLPWLFICAMLTVLGLVVHYWQKFAAEPLLLERQDEQSRSIYTSGEPV